MTLTLYLDPNPYPDPNQADICCPLIAWLEGKQYNNVQTAHAIGGLGELLQQNGAVFELGLASVDSPDAPPMSPEQVTGGIKHSNPSPTPTPAASPHPSPCPSPDQVCRAAMSLDLTRPEECEKAELTLRHGCLMQVLPLPWPLPLPLTLALTLSGAHPAPRLPGAVHGDATLRGPRDRGCAG